MLTAAKTTLMTTKRTSVSTRMTSTDASHEHVVDNVQIPTGWVVTNTNRTVLLSSNHIAMGRNKCFSSFNFGLPCLSYVFLVQLWLAVLKLH